MKKTIFTINKIYEKFKISNATNCGLKMLTRNIANEYGGYYV